jgi:predicted dehydrogenase
VTLELQAKLPDYFFLETFKVFLPFFMPSEGMKLKRANCIILNHYEHKEFINLNTNADSKELEVGIVGLGKMGVMHACLLNVLPNVKLKVFCDKSRLMRRFAKRIFNECLVTDKLDKLEDLNLDAVYVLTPIPSHYFIIKELLTKNTARNLFVEKTLSSNYAQSQELYQLTQRRQGNNMVGYMKRFGVTFNQAKKLLVDHALGELTSFEAYAFSSDFADAPEGSLISAARGGALEDLGSHVVDLALWFFGDLEVVSPKLDVKVSQNSADNVNFAVTGLNGLQGRFEVSWCKKGYRMPEFELVVQGTAGKLTINDDEVRLELKDQTRKDWYRQNLNDSVGFLLGGPEYYREDEHFIKSLLSGDVPESDFKSAMRVDYLLDQVRCRTANA